MPGAVFALLVLIQTAISLPNPTFSQERVPEVTVPNTELHEFRADAGTRYDLSIALPLGFDPDDGTAYPVLYSLDANLGFAATVQMYRFLEVGREVRPMILVGIDKPTTSFLEALAVRTLDLTPTSVPDQEEELGPTGGADVFLEVLRGEIIPWVEERYPTTSDRGIAGYSLGGLFAIHALFSAPELFTRYSIGSPSLWWDSGLMFEREQAYSEEFDDLPAHVFMSVGTLEGETMLPDMLRMAEVLRSREYESLELETQVFPDETHLSGVAPSISRGLRVLFGPP